MTMDSGRKTQIEDGLNGFAEGVFPSREGYHNWKDVTTGKNSQRNHLAMPVFADIKIEFEGITQNFPNRI